MKRSAVSQKPFWFRGTLEEWQGMTQVLRDYAEENWMRSQRPPRVPCPRCQGEGFVDADEK